jgi:hypothetical protein
MPQGRYRLDRVNIELKSDRPARWKIREEPLVRGTEYVYGVTDGNYAQRNEWEFLVRVPKKKGSIEVRPSSVPPVKVWNGMERRAMMFRADQAGAQCRRLLLQGGACGSRRRTYAADRASRREEETPVLAEAAEFEDAIEGSRPPHARHRQRLAGDHRRSRRSPADGCAVSRGKSVGPQGRIPASRLSEHRADVRSHPMISPVTSRSPSPSTSC